MLEDKDRFEQVRRITIVNSVQDRLAYYIQRHNQVALRNGVSYTFALPLISQEEWVNTMDDIGMMAFIQGIPMGDQYYNNYALGGGRLVKAPVYFGGVDSRGSDIITVMSVNSTIAWKKCSRVPKMQRKQDIRRKAVLIPVSSNP